MSNTRKASRNYFSIFLLGVLFLAASLLFPLKSVSADTFHNNGANITSSLKNRGASIYDSDGIPVSSANKYHVKLLMPDHPGYSYYFENHYVGAYDWVKLASKTEESEYTYTIMDPLPEEGGNYYFKDVTDNGYLKTYKPDIWYLKGGVYEGGKSGADKWHFSRSSAYPNKYAYHMTSDRDGVTVDADPFNSGSLVVNKNYYDFVVIFEKA